MQLPAAINMVAAGAASSSAPSREWLKEAVPNISRVLVASYALDPVTALQLKELESAAGSLGVKLLVQDIRTADNLPTAFDAGTISAWRQSQSLCTSLR